MQKVTGQQLREHGELLLTGAILWSFKMINRHQTI